MANAFPLYVYLSNCDCIVIGGGEYAAHSAETLLRFGARVTVISPTLCPALRELDREGKIRYIPRKYFRGDCTPATLCVAATNADAVNITVADECKAKGIPVNLSSPAGHSTYVFPVVSIDEGLTLSLAGKWTSEVLPSVQAALDGALPKVKKSLDTAEAHPQKSKE